MYAFLASSSWTSWVEFLARTLQKIIYLEWSIWQNSWINPHKTFPSWTRSSRVGRVREIKSTFVDKFKNNLWGAHCLFLMHSPLQLFFFSFSISYLCFHPQSLSFSRSTVAMVAVGWQQWANKEQKTFPLLTPARVLSRSLFFFFFFI